jgi:hypothetical protein
MNPDLEAERKGASFVVEELSTFLNGGKEKTQRKNQILDILEKENAFRKVFYFMASIAQIFARMISHL